MSNERLNALLEANTNPVRDYVFNTTVASGVGIFPSNYSPSRDGFATFSVAVKDSTAVDSTAVNSFVPYLQVTDGTDTYLVALNGGVVVADGQIHSWSVPVVGPYAATGITTIRTLTLSYNFSVDKELEIAYATIQEAQ